MQSQADAANRFTWVFVDAWHVFRSRAARNSPFVGFGVASLEALDSRINHRVLRGEFWLLEEGYWSAATSRGKQVEPATHVSPAVILLYVGLPNFCLDSWPSFALAGFSFFFFF